MNRYRWLLTCLLLLVVAARPAGAASPPAVTGVSPAQAQQVLTVLQDPQKRDQLISTLQTLTKTVASTPATPIPLVPDSLGAQIVTASADWTHRVWLEMRHATSTIGNLPLLWRWLRHVLTNADARARIMDANLRLLVVLACAGAAEYGLRRVLHRPIQAVEQYGKTKGSPQPEPEPDLEWADAPAVGSEPGASEPGASEPVVSEPESGVPPASGVSEASTPETAMADTAAHAAIIHHRHRLQGAWRLMGRLPAALARLALDLLPVLLFLGVANLFLGTELGEPLPVRLLIMKVIYAYAICRLVIAVTTALVAPCHPHLRLVRLGAFGAGFVACWVRRITLVVVFGIALAQGAVVLGLNQRAQIDLIKSVMLVAHVMLIIAVLQCRAPVSRHLRPRKGRTGVIALLLNRLASVWHWVAIFYIVALWLVWAVELRDGLSRLMHFFVVSVGVLLLARLLAIVLLGALYRCLSATTADGAERPVSTLQARTERYLPLLRGSVTALVSVLALLVLLQSWGVGAFGWFLRGGIGVRLLSAFGSVLVTVMIAIVVWETTNAALERNVTRLTADGANGRAARLRTLMPILRTTLLIAITVIIGMTILSEIGVNIAPLLAGAGIVGVALGFGSQKLVQDLITGLFLLLENAMQVGDWVTVAGLSGSVEHLSIRTIRLRAGDGSLHIIPFSSVTSVNNVNRGIANATVDVTVIAAEDADRVGEALKAIAADMRTDPAFSAMISSDLQLWGVDKLDGATINILGRIPCVDTGRWGVQREFNRRVHKRFAELGIRLAVPTQAVLLQPAPEPVTAVKPPPAAMPGSPGPGGTAATDTQSPPPAATGHDR